MRIQIKILIILTILTASCQEKKNTESKNQSIYLIESDIDKTIKDPRKFDCYTIDLKLSTEKYVFIDTTLSLRNYRFKDSSKRIICNPEFIDLETEKLIWECKYVRNYCDYVERLNTNRFAILDYNQINDSSVVAGFYISDKRDLKTGQMTSFLITNGEIVGINILPDIQEQFVPIAEYDRFEPFEM